MGLAAGSSTSFFFIAAVFFLYWAAPARPVRLAVILLANYFFCARFGLFYLALMPACGTADFLIGLRLMRSENALARRAWVALSVAMNLALLLGARHMGALLNPHGWDWIFPLGLSFYALQALTYTLDLYRRDAKGGGSLLAYLSAVCVLPDPSGRSHHPRHRPDSANGEAHSAEPRRRRTRAVSDRPRRP